MFAKVSKKVLAVALIVALGFSVAQVDNADAKIAKKCTLKQGERKKLNAGAKATWKSSNPGVATVLAQTDGAAAKTEVVACKKGKATITATVGGKKQTCKVTVKNRTKGYLIYNMAKDETDPKKVPGSIFKYDTFKYSSYCIFQPSVSFFGKGHFASADYRGRKIKMTVTIQNAGKRTLPEFAVCMNWTKSKVCGPYPFMLHVMSKDAWAKNYKKNKGGKQWKECTFKKMDIKKGKKATFTFSFKIPTDAVNTDADKTYGPYPFNTYIPNLKDSGPYKPGDDIKVLAWKCWLAS